MEFKSPKVIKMKLLFWGFVPLVLVALFFFFRTVNFTLNTYDQIANHQEVVDADLITHSKISFDSFEKCQNDFCSIFTMNGDAHWTDISLFQYDIKSHSGYQSGLENRSIQYQLQIDSQKLKSLSQDDLAITFPYIYLNRFGIYLNGLLIQVGRGNNSVEALTVVSIPKNALAEEEVVITILGELDSVDLGLNSYVKPLIGPQSILKEIALDNERAMITYYLLFFISFGTLFVLFSMLMFFTQKKSAYVNVTVFTLCALTDLLMRSDLLAAYINLNQMLTILNVAHLLGSMALFRFFVTFLNLKVSDKIISAFGGGLLAFGLFISYSFAHNLLPFSIPQIFLINNSIRFFIVLTALFFSAFEIVRVKRKEMVLYGFSFALSLLVGLMGYLYYFYNAEFYNPIVDVLFCLFISINTFIEFGQKEKTVLVQERLLLQQERDVAIGKTAGMLAHDVRKPFAQLDMILSQMESGDLGPEFLRNSALEIKQSLNHVTSMVSEIMDFGRDSEIQLHSISLKETIGKALKQLMIVDDGLEIHFNHVHNVLGDQGRLIRALVNVLSNGIEASESLNLDKNTLVIETSEDEHFSEIRVINDGPLIPDEIIEIIFDPFVTSGKNHGTGLGLASVKKIIDLHKGIITIQNREDQRGVVVSIKVLKSNDLDVSAQKAETLAQKVRILACDDSFLPLFMLEEILKSIPGLDFELQTFKTAEDLLSISEVEKYDYLFSDVNLTDGGGTLNGPELIQLAKGKNNNLQCYLWSNFVDHKLEKTALDVGAITILAMPLESDQIASVFRIIAQDQEGASLY
ncbi:MAG: hypothetical protein COW00_05180 [Bdellovibrio sp. CG12_big_fil_rev_8_21_14_0_65_39_13]|nr:MAG: hypothetical protein COW78_13380 [Bdellovibrio sp. CG22_combo_CG10-13_8_21_14_all_39_27]PIQ61202.1 MAG: hypothetical protein COW00_05180 [Bdellovibrio sp. CG12_big_fil_rev_8_21_14_0_65_39_13]PIR34872.1 MAG: hypothetical protein COV37_11455 [Bdellovibrio sp. CG11_big_fil_rev_8_21_14_0_20_39_38]